MSIQAVAWAINQHAGSPSAKLLLIAIANYANDKGEAHPSHARLAKETELSRRSVVTLIKTLKDAGLLNTKRRYKDGYRVADEISLCISMNVDTSSGELSAKTARKKSGTLGANDCANDAVNCTAEPLRTVKEEKNFDFRKFVPGSRTPETLDAYQSAAATRFTKALQDSGLAETWWTHATAEQEAACVKAERYKRGTGIEKARQILQATKHRSAAE